MISRTASRMRSRAITHSICTLEFEDHRPLYDWLIEHLPVPSRPHQYEFARLNIAYTVLSKRVLTRLVQDGHVSGWDDPRMPTLAGLRRRGVPPAALREFVRRVGVAKANSVVDIAQYEHAIRETLNRTAPRRMAVLRPLKLVIENWPEEVTETLDAVNNPEDASAGMRQVTFGREVYVEREDFMENPPEEVLPPGARARGTAALCLFRYLHASSEGCGGRGGGAALHLRSGDAWRRRTRWAAACKRRCIGSPRRTRCQRRCGLYNQLFARPDPGADGDVMADLNPEFAGGADRLPGRAGPGIVPGRRGGAVRANRLFLRRPK